MKKQEKAGLEKRACFSGRTFGGSLHAEYQGFFETDREEKRDHDGRADDGAGLSEQDLSLTPDERQHARRESGTV